ncbi:MAG: TonB-dependent receptor [Bryobacterales bacterium]|nr:TonB-dependent receptor [Bryobacterales bacterium]
MLKNLTTMLGLLVLLSASLCGQMNRGTITGLLTDPSSAVVPGATVVVQNAGTGSRYETTTTETGQYTVPNLPVGEYEVIFTSPNFKKLVKTGITLGATQVLRIDATLEVGQVAESVSVTAEVPRIQSETREVGTSLDNQQLRDLPLSFAGARSPEIFAYKIAPGVAGDFWQSSINGSMRFSKEVMVDGASATTQLGGDYTTGFVSVEAIGEFKVVTSGMSAEFGRSQGGLFNFVLKSGSNDLHGSAVGMLRNEAFNSNGFANNARGVRRPLDRRQLGGGSFGGPVYLPKVYNGRNKTFFYTAYERYRERNLGFGSPNRTVPIPDFYEGDFSRLLGPSTGQRDALGRDVLRGAIYDPGTFRRLDGGRWIGEMFPGNVIPRSRFSQVSQRVTNIMKQYYQPVVRQPDGQFALINNALFPIANAPVFDNHQFSLKMDQNITDKHKLTGSYSYAVKNRSTLADAGGIWAPGESDGGPFSAARSQRLGTTYARIAHDWIATPTVVNNITASFNWLHAPTLSRHVDVDGAKELGIRNLSTFGFPTINWGGGPFVGLTNLGDPTRAINNFIQWGLLDTVSWTRGKHFIKFGIDIRTNQLNNRATQGGGFNFAARGTAIPGEAFAGNLTGYSMASFLLGVVDSAGLNDPVTLGGRRKYFGTFIQDDFKVTSRLTLQLGLRWEFQPPMYEVNDQLSSWSPTARDPLSGLLGAYQFAGKCNSCTGRRYFGTRSFRDFSPRLGVAYRMSDKTTLRGGYGIFFAGDLFNGFNATPLGKATNVQAGGTFALAADPVQPWFGIFNWDNGFPTDRYVPPVFDPSWARANGPGMFDPNYGRTPYVQEWNLNVQREVWNKVVVDLGYIGNKSTGLWNGTLERLNQLPASVLTQYGRALNNPVRNAAEAATNGVAYPYAGFSGTVAGALRPFPQIIGIGTVNNFGATRGFANYHSFQITVNRQFGKGMSIYGNYVWSKNLSNTRSLMIGDNPGPLDYYNLALEKAVVEFDRRHVGKIFVDYQLPFGRGKALLSNAGKVTNLLVNGWSFSAILNYSSGTPLGFGGSFPLSGGWNGATNRANIVAGNLTVPFDKSKFNLLAPLDPANTFLNKGVYSDPAPLTLGTSAPRYDQARAFGIPNEDFSLHKNVFFGEKYRVQFRADMLNAFNRSVLGGIQTGITSPQFGQVTGIGGTRQVQLGLRLDF